MAFISKKNNAFSKVATVGGIDASTNPVTFAVTTSDGAKFPSSNFKISIDSEIMLCTSRTGDSLTCTRAQESTTIAAHSQNADVELRITAGTLEEYDNVLKATGQTSEADNLLLKEQADPTTTPSAGYKKIYADTDDKLYTIDDAGAAKQILQTGDVSGGNTIALFRQALINGNFDVWQRGTSLVITADTAQFLADRYVNVFSPNGGTLPTITLSRQAITPGSVNNAFYNYRVAWNGAGSSLGNSSYAQTVQKIEHGVRYLCGNGKKVTISFWARSDISGKKLGISLQTVYGTGGSPSATENIITQAPITLTSTWTKYTVTFTTNTLSGKTFGTANNDYLALQFFYQWGTTVGNGNVYPSVAAETYVGAGYVDIAQVQLCAGDVALDFMPKSYAQEKLDCERYYQISPLSGIAYDTGFLAPACSFKPEMRITPTAYTFYDGIDGTGTANQLSRLGGANADVSSLTTISIYSTGIGYINKTSAFTTGGHYRGSVRADAEI